MMKYFELNDDIAFPNRWWLGKVIQIDGDVFAQPPFIPMNDGRRDQVYEVELKVNGVSTDYTTTTFRSVPLGSFKVIQALSGLDGFTAFPARIVNFAQKTSYHILHFWDVLDCFDEEQSAFEIIPFNDPIRPDLAGNYRSVTKLRIDPHKAVGKHIFRIARLEGRIIVSEDVKKRFEDLGITGAVFDAVV
ncbi:imm11 family protein [Ochrobactrum quorumnocens]|uniref:imm11 family protein n=1 Tax=Ochrobactrum quorumnocens TaxID=271865 RepID=UPI0012FD426A|nr:DUF1629 domain-containing protein [[Ochrobactrum] quorumnocens]